jgi:CO/xanthine dehydrogenase Mo-binding subunit
MSELAPSHNIGGYVPMVDGPEKVSGRAKYTADILGTNQLAARIYRSPYSHGEIVEVDISEALRLPGVHAVITGADCDRTFGVLPVARSEHPLARDRVRYRGEPVAAVAADNDSIAREALRRIKLKVRELPAYYTARDALAPMPCFCTRKRRVILNATFCLSWAALKKVLPRPIWCATALITAPKSVKTRWRCMRP